MSSTICRVLGSNSSHGVVLEVDRDGQTSYRFAANQPSSTLTLRSNPRKGICLFTETKLAQGQIVLDNIALASIVIESGKNSSQTSSKLCSTCCCQPVPTTTVIPASTQAYCSSTCENEGKLFEDIFGKVLKKFRAENPLLTSSEADIVRLTFQYFFQFQQLLSSLQATTSTTALYNISAYLQIWNLHHNATFAHSSSMTQKLWKYLQENEASKQSLFQLSEYIELSPITLKTLLEIITCNAQMIPIYSINPSASSSSSSYASNGLVMTLLPTIPRINHSCSPNTSLVVKTLPIDTDHPKKRLQVSVLAMKDVEAGSELTMTYLQDVLLTSSETSARQELLQQNAHFECHCIRCQFNHPAFINARSPKHPSLSLRERRIGEMLSFLHQQFLTSSVLGPTSATSLQEMNPDDFLHEMNDLLPRYEILLHEVNAMMVASSNLSGLDDAYTMLSNALVFILSPAQSHLNLLYSYIPKESESALTIAKLFIRYYEIVLQSSQLLVRCIDAIFVCHDNSSAAWPSCQQLECILTYVLHVSMCLKYWMNLADQFPELKSKLNKDGKQYLLEGLQRGHQGLDLIESSYREVRQSTNTTTATTQVNKDIIITIESKDCIQSIENKLHKLCKYLQMLQSSSTSSTYFSVN